MTDHVHQMSSRSSPGSAPPAPDRLRSLGLDRNPFTGSGPLVPDAGQQDALGEIQGWIEAIAANPAWQDRLAVLTAGPGMGKSRLLREIAAGSGEGIISPLIDPGKGGLTDAQLLRAIIDAFGGTATGRTGMDLRRDIRHAIADLPEGIVPGLLIDDADYSGSRLELIRNVLRDGAGRGLFIVLTGLPDLADRLGRRRSFRAILGPTVHLGPMDPSSLLEVIASRTDGLPLVSQDAIEATVERAEGSPGRLLRLAELGVEIAARQDQRQVERSAVIDAAGQMESAAGNPPDASEGETAARSAVQAEIPLFPSGWTGRASSTTTQRTLWDGGAGDDRAPD